MARKRINVVWLDDNIDKLDNESTKRLFESHDCVLFKKAKTSDELSSILKEFKSFIDAVIVDFNVGKSTLVPDINSANGFISVQEHLLDYPSIPFYLFSARDIDFIRNKYLELEYEMETDYFFRRNTNVSSGRNRYFQAHELEDLLVMINEEVDKQGTPEYRVRQEYLEAFNVIERFQLDGYVFLDILMNSDIDRYDLSGMPNKLRKVIENLISKLKNVFVIPESYSLNGLPDLLACKKRKGQIPKVCMAYKSQDYMSQSLYAAFNLFLLYTQDGSHDKDISDSSNAMNEPALKFHSYLRESSDVYLVRSLAIIGLDVIRWLGKFYDKYAEIKPFEFIPFEGKVVELSKNMGGAIVISPIGERYFIKQPNDNKERYHVGSNVRIKNRSITSPNFGD